MADVADEEIGYDNIDTVVGISINGIALPTKWLSFGIRHDGLPNHR